MPGRSGTSCTVIFASSRLNATPEMTAFSMAMWGSSSKVISVPAFAQIGADRTFLDGGDARLGVRGIGGDFHLPAGIAAGLHAHLDERHRKEANRHLLASGGDHIELARIGNRLDFLGERDQAVGL